MSRTCTLDAWRSVAALRAWYLLCTAHLLLARPAVLQNAALTRACAPQSALAEPLCVLQVSMFLVAAT